MRWLGYIMIVLLGAAALLLMFLGAMTVLTAL